MLQKRMKRLALAAVVLLLATTANAQLLQYGIKGGINQTNPNIDNFKAGSYKVFDDKREIGYQFGAFARIKLLMIYVQPELNYSVQKSSVSITDNKGATSNGVKYEVSTLNVPVLFGFKLGPVRLNAGPMYTKNISANSAFKNFDGYKYSLNGSSWGYAAGVGIDLFKMLTADLRYEGGFGKQATLTGAQNSISVGKPGNVSLTVGIFL